MPPVQPPKLKHRVYRSPNPLRGSGAAARMVEGVCLKPPAFAGRSSPLAALDGFERPFGPLTVFGTKNQLVIGVVHASSPTT
jgi:hypothetical protein